MGEEGEELLSTEELRDGGEEEWLTGRGAEELESMRLSLSSKLLWKGRK